MSQDDRAQTRRRFLTTSTALGVAASLAGCSSELTGESGDGSDDSGDESSTETPASTATPTEDSGPFGIGSSQEFTLEEGDGRDPYWDDLAKPVTFEASAGDEVTITQRSDAFDPYLVLEAPSGEVVEQNDDIEFAENTDSRISTTLGESGEYTIWAGSLDGESTGPFTLSVERGLTESADTEQEDDTDSDPVDPESISYGETLDFTLQEGDGRDPAWNDLAKPVAFEASAGDEVTITQRSDAFDTYLVLEAPSGEVVEQNDDIEFAENTDSRISMTLGESGEYIIWAGSLDGESTGSFSLSLERGLTGGSEDDTDSDPVDPESISYGETLDFTLQEGDGRDPYWDDLAKPVAFEASAGDEVTITQRSDAFDTYLVLEAPSGEVVEQNDDIDYGENLDSRISMTLGESGEYIIWAGSLDGESTGPFTLSLERGLTDTGESTL